MILYQYIHTCYFARSAHFTIYNSLFMTVHLPTSPHLAPECTMPIEMLLYLSHLFHADHLVLICVDRTHLPVLLFTDHTKFSRLVSLTDDDFLLLDLLLQTLQPLQLFLTQITWLCISFAIFISVLFKDLVNHPSSYLN